MTLHSSWTSCCCQAKEDRPTKSPSLNVQTHRPVSRLATCMRGVSALTLTTVPTKTPRYVGGLDCPFLTGLQENKQPLQLVRDAGDWILLRLFKLPAEMCQRCENKHVISGGHHAGFKHNHTFLLVECISEFWSHEQSLQEAVEITGHSLVDQTDVTWRRGKERK